MLGESMDSLTSPTTPSPSPSPGPSPEPTGVCIIDLEMECIVADSETQCTDEEGEKDTQCSCADCVQEMGFVYTAKSCDADFAYCFDAVTSPGTNANVVISNYIDDTDILHSNVVEFSDEIRISRSDGSCLPEHLFVYVKPSDANDWHIPSQTFNRLLVPRPRLVFAVLIWSS
jgi:hypothetical protein